MIHAVRVSPIFIRIHLEAQTHGLVVVETQGPGTWTDYPEISADANSLLIANSRGGVVRLDTSVQVSSYGGRNTCLAYKRSRNGGSIPNATEAGSPPPSFSTLGFLPFTQEALGL